MIIYVNKKKEEKYRQSIILKIRYKNMNRECKKEIEKRQRTQCEKEKEKNYPRPSTKKNTSKRPLSNSAQRKFISNNRRQSPRHLTNTLVFTSPARPPLGLRPNKHRNQIKAKKEKKKKKKTHPLTPPPPTPYSAPPPFPQT